MGVVQVKNQGDLAIVATVRQVSEDGRESTPNGRFVIEPGAARSLMLDADQQIHLTQGEAPEAPEGGDDQ